MKQDKKVQWHSAFYGATQLELSENKMELEFSEDFQLLLTDKAGEFLPFVLYIRENLLG